MTGELDRGEIESQINRLERMSKLEKPLYVCAGFIALGGVLNGESNLIAQGALAAGVVYMLKSTTDRRLEELREELPPDQNN